MPGPKETAIFVTGIAVMDRSTPLANPRPEGNAALLRNGSLPNAALTAGTSSAKHHRAMPIEHDAVLDVAAHGAGEHQRFGIAAHAHQIARGHGVVHAGDVLFDDGTFVQVFGDVMGGGANDLDPRACAW